MQMKKTAKDAISKAIEVLCSSQDLILQAVKKLAYKLVS